MLDCKCGKGRCFAAPFRLCLCIYSISDPVFFNLFCFDVL